MELRNLAAGLLMLAVLPAGTAMGEPAVVAQQQGEADEEQASNSQAQAAGPQEVIEKAANEVLDSIEGRRDELSARPQELYAIVDKILLPHFDIEYAARLILARSWREASQEQRERFQEAMYQSLVRTYADGILEFTADSMEMLPFRGSEDDERVTVQTEVTLDDGTKAPVNYVMHQADGQWKVFDVFIEGISYVLNYRKQLGAEIGQKGLENVIRELERNPRAIEAEQPAGADSAS